MIDKILDEELPKVQEIPGFVKMTRTVCKTEWAYEFAFIFASLSDLEAYMASDYRQNTLLKKLEEMKMYMVDLDKLYTGNRVYDEFQKTKDA